MNANPKGILLLAFGGPDSSEAVEPFMKNLMGGRTPPPALVEKVKARYEMIGGKSPLPGITAGQAAELEKYLKAQGGDFRVAVGMRYWHPFIQEGVQSLLDKGVETIIALSLAPFFSRVSTGAYMEELEKVTVSLTEPPLKITAAAPFYGNSFFIEAVAEKIIEGLNEFPADRRKNVQTIFSAHSLPVTYIQEGDPYVEQFEFTVNRLVEKLQLPHWHVAYQSKGGGQGEWLGPMVEEVMDNISRQGFTDVLVVPVGFVSDHIETLYDIDIAQKKYASSLGLNFHRTASLNTSDLFIRALAATILEKSG